MHRHPAGWLYVCCPYFNSMHTDYTVIPVFKRDEILSDLKDLQSEVEDYWQDMRLQNIIFRLDCWSNWDPTFLRLVGETEEEQRQVSTAEVSDLSAASI